MYEIFYGFREKPFSLLPDPAFLYLGKSHSMAMAMLQYGMSSQAGFTVIGGEVGSGKTTLIRHLLNQMGDEITVGLISNTHRDLGELLQWVCLAFELDFHGKEKVGLYAEFQNFMIREYAQNRRTVLIIDEAQNLTVATLEELRMLSNINADKDQLLQLILVGQPELRETLRRPSLKQFAQRVAIAYYLGHLGEKETFGYIAHRLKVAGGNPALFYPAAIKLIHKYANGTPRIINNLCDLALVYGFAEQKPRIGTKIVEEVVRDKAEGGLFTVDEPEDTAIDNSVA